MIPDPDETTRPAGWRGGRVVGFSSGRDRPPLVALPVARPDLQQRAVGRTLTGGVEALPVDGLTSVCALEL